MTDVSAGSLAASEFAHAGLRVKILDVATPTTVLVLLHGIPSVAPPDPDDEGYEGFARRLAAGSRAAMWADLRGARGAGGFFSIEGWVQDATALVGLARSRYPGSPVVLIGSSAGGAVALEVAARAAPVAAVACLGTPAQWGSFADDGAEGIVRIEEQAGMPVAPHHKDDPGAWAAEFEGVTAERSVERCRVPVLVMHGTADDVVPVAHAGRLGEGTNVELRILEGTGHQLRRDRNAVAVLEEWLARVTR